MDLRDFDAKVEAQIAQHGWMVQGVFPAVQGDSSWCYTVGVEDKGGPEFCIIGLPHRVAASILNHVVENSLALSVWPEDGQILSGYLGEGYDLKVVQVARNHIMEGDWFNVATHRRGRREGFVGLQLVWPNEHGHYHSTDYQPILAKPCPTAPPSGDVPGYESHDRGGRRGPERRGSVVRPQRQGDGGDDPAVGPGRHRRRTGNDRDVPGAG